MKINCEQTKNLKPLKKLWENIFKKLREKKIYYVTFCLIVRKFFYIKK